MSMNGHEQGSCSTPKTPHAHCVVQLQHVPCEQAMQVPHLHSPALQVQSCEKNAKKAQKQLELPMQACHAQTLSSAEGQDAEQKLGTCAVHARYNWSPQGNSPEQSCSADKGS